MLMRRRQFISAASFPILGFAKNQRDGDHLRTQRVVLIDTAMGLIKIALDFQRAPLTSAHFLHLIGQGVYDKKGSFYRVVDRDTDTNPAPISVIQGGFGLTASSQITVAHESTAVTGLRHLDGTISMARVKPGSASSEFFICLGANPELDFGGRRAADGQGFAAFGQIISGMRIVRGIHAQTASGGADVGVPGQMLDRPVPILSTAIGGEISEPRKVPQE